MRVRGVNTILALVEDRRLLTAAGGAVAIVVGSFLPWSHTDVILAEITEYGVNASGRITFVLGLVSLAAVLAYASLRHADLAAGAALPALASIGLAVHYQRTIAGAGLRAAARESGTGAFRATTGAGVWVVVAGGAALVAAVVILLASRRRETPAEE